MKKKTLNSIIAILLILLVGTGGFFAYKKFVQGKADTKQNAPAAADPSGDTDHDGLINSQESYYGTDPLNPDSDNDGYSDGEEVKSGFNPLGAGKLNTSKLPVGQYSGISLEQVFGGKGSYLCTMSLSQQNTPMKVTLKVKDAKIRQELTPNFPDTNNARLDPIVLIKNGTNVYFGNGIDANGWLLLTYNNETKSWSSPGVTISGGLFATPADVTAAHPDKVECSSVDLEDVEFVVPAKFIIQPGQTYEQFQKNLNLLKK